MRCGTSRQLATGTCDGDVVQATCFSSRRVVRVDHSGSTRQGSTRAGVLSERECASGSLRDGQAACQDTPADLMHTLPAMKKKGRDTRHKADAPHDTVTSPQHEHVTQLCTSLVSTSRRASVITRDIVHSYSHTVIQSYRHTDIQTYSHIFIQLVCFLSACCDQGRVAKSRIQSSSLLKWAPGVLSPSSCHS